MEPAELVSAIRVVVIDHFELAAKDFNDRPSAFNWGHLQDAMWARQALTSKDTMDYAAKTFSNVGVGRWIEELRKFHEGKQK